MSSAPKPYEKSRRFQRIGGFIVAGAVDSNHRPPGYPAPALWADVSPIPEPIEKRPPIALIGGCLDSEGSIRTIGLQVVSPTSG
jgi:hypothetical protein